MKNTIYLFLLSMLVFASCEPFQDDDIELGAAPATPEFSIEVSPDDPNTIIVKDLSSGNFTRVWNFGENADGQRPLKRTSTESIDTVNYIKAGEYTITLYVSAEGGSGTAQNSKTITIQDDAVTGCSGTVALITGDCLPTGRCWTFSQVAGAISVGPNPGDYSWFTSPAGGLVPEQYDDSYCFFLDNQVFDYQNNGATVNPFDGYQAQPFTNPADMSWTFSPGTGADGADQIILADGLFWGVRDASNVGDIITISETELVIRAKQVDATGAATPQGWFDIYFVAL